jgi:hypothetical protein
MKLLQMLLIVLIGLLLLAGCAAKEVKGERVEIQAGEATVPPAPTITTSGLPDPFNRQIPGLLAKSTAPAETPSEMPAETVPSETVPTPPMPPPTKGSAVIQPGSEPAVAAFNAFVQAFASKNGEASWNLLASAAKNQFNTLYAQLQQQAVKNPQLAGELKNIKSGKDLWIQSMTMSTPDARALAETQVIGSELKGNICVLTLRNGSKINMIQEGGSWKVNPGP